MPIPKALKGVAPSSVRMVGRRQIPNDADLMRQEDIDLLRDQIRAENAARLKTSPDRREFAVEDFEDAWSAIEAKATASHRILQPAARKDHERLVAESLPSVCAVEYLFTTAIDADEALAQKLAQGHTALVVVRHRKEANWLSVVEKAWTRAMRLVALRLDAGVPISVDAIGVAGVRPDAEDVGTDIELIVERLTIGSVLALVPVGVEVDEVIGSLADLTVDLDVHQGAIGYAIRSRFPDATWSTDLDAGVVTPKALDVAVSRARSAPEALELLWSLVAAVVARRAREDGVVAKAKVGQPSTKPDTKKGAVEILHPTAPRLEDLYVSASFRTWGEDLVRDVEAFRTGRLPWLDVDGGCLLYGPPGTGKTMIVSALAASLGVAFIPTSFAVWQGARGGHLGDVVKAMRSVFEAAAENAPCLIFIDEIDSIPARGGDDEHESYWRPIVNGMLECLDGTARREGVIVIAATNDPSRLDPAMVRSGRLDRRFEIALPDEDGLLRVMRHHLPDADADALRPAATVLAGTATPADIARIAREARRVARRQDRTVTAEDMLGIAMPPDTRSDDLRRLAAVHEAGHAVACLVGGRVPLSLSVVGGAGTHGGVTMDVDTGCGRLADFERLVVERLAGRAAEEVILGLVSGGAGGGEGSDLHVATRLVGSMLGSMGLGERIAHADRIAEREVEKRLHALYDRALDVVRERRADVEALADLALERRVLSRAALAAFAEERGLGR